MGLTKNGRLPVKLSEREIHIGENVLITVSFYRLARPSVNINIAYTFRALNTQNTNMPCSMKRVEALAYAGLTLLSEPLSLRLLYSP